MRSFAVGGSTILDVDQDNEVSILVDGFEREMWDAAAEVRDLRATIEETEQLLRRARNVAGSAVRRYGTALELAGLEVERETIRALYWDNPEIRVQDIGEAFSIAGGPGAVHLHTGAKQTEHPCRGGCGSTLTIKNRTTSPNERLCGLCRTARLSAMHASYEASKPARRAAQAAEERRNRLWAREQLDAGMTAQQVLASWSPETTDGLARAIFAGHLITELSGAPLPTAAS